METNGEGAATTLSTVWWGTAAEGLAEQWPLAMLLKLYACRRCESHFALVVTDKV